VIPLPAKSSYGVAGWSPDVQRVASGWGDGLVYVHDLASGRQLASRSTGDGLVTGVAFTADADQVVATTDTGEVRFLDAETLAPRAPALQLFQPMNAVTTNPRGHTAFVVLGGPSQEWFQDSEAVSWALVDTDDGTLVRSGGLGLASAELAAFSPDGVHVAVSGRNGQVVVIDTRTGRASAGPTLRQRSRLFWVTYNHDGSQFLTSSDDGVARIWDARTATQLGSFQRPRGIAMGAFRPDGTILLTNGRGEIFVWDPSPEAAIDFACRAAGRDLTTQEWRDSFGARPFQDPCPD
jgi:WD40 repeat protein